MPTLTQSQKRANRASTNLVPPPTEGPRILVFDIETFPALGYYWNIWQTNIIATKEDYHLLSFAYAWWVDGELTETQYVALDHAPRWKPGSSDDKYVAERLWWLLDQSTHIVAHNLQKFDEKKSNTAFRKNGLTAPSPYRTIDTLKEYKRYFGDNSNSLNEIARSNNLGAKVDHPGFVMWLGYKYGDPEWMKLMEEYTHHDVVLLGKVYELLIPWMGRPGNYRGLNHGFWHPGETVCPSCASTHLVKRGFRESVYQTGVSEFQVFQCMNCEGYGRARLREPQKKGEGVQIV